jgi:hypothetical protein
MGRYPQIPDGSVRLQKKDMGKMHQTAEEAAFNSLKLLLLLSLCAVVVLTGGCAAMAALPLSALIGSPNSQNMQFHNNTDVRIEQKNFQVIKTNVVGESKGFSLLGFITIVPARVTTAMNRLYANAEMQYGQPQMIANFMMEQNSSYYILFGIPRTTMRADIIEFTPPPPIVNEPPPPPPETKDKPQ